MRHAPVKKRNRERPSCTHCPHKGEACAHRAIPLLGLICNGLSLFVTATVAIKTQPSTPGPAAIAGIILLAVAFILTGIRIWKVSAGASPDGLFIAWDLARF